MTDETRLEYRVVNKVGTEVVVMGGGRPLIGPLGLRAAEAGRLWHNHAYPGLAPYAVESRPFRNEGWTRVEVPA